MEPVPSDQVFEEDADMPVTELEDGSALVEMPSDEEVVESDHLENLAEKLDDFVLNQLATDIIELIDKDKEARKKRDEQYEEGLKRTGLGDDAPGGAEFEGASRAVHPVLAEGCVDFAARAIKELIPPNGPVKTKITTDADRKTLERAQKKRDYLNFLLMKKMRGYRDEKEILLTQLPLGGSQYEKYYVHPVKRSYTMEFVPVDKVLLPFAATSFYTTPRLTHMVDLTRAQFEERVESGFYRDITGVVTESNPEQTASQAANDKIEGVEESNYNEDGLRLIYETVIDWEIEEEHKQRCPYVIHTDKSTGKILAIYRNWAENDDDYERLDWWVEDKFIPWRGAYGIGLPHLIGGLAGALTGALRALLDSAHINNSPGAIKLKSGRASGQNIVIEQTQVQEIEAPAGIDDIRKAIMPLPFNPPSAVLYQLLDWITAQAKGVVATAEEKIADASNQMPVGTALALIEQGSQVFSSIHSRLHESQRRSFEIICRLIRDYPNEEELREYGLTAEDFDENDDIQPVSDPHIFSESQRYAQLQEQIKTMATFPDLKWNRDEFARRALELLRTDGIDALLPKKPEDVTADPVTENFLAVTTGAALKANQEQDHIAHLREHIRFILDPLFGAGPAIPGPALAPILGHCQQHLMIMYDVASKQAAMMNVEETGESPEMAIAQAAEFASAEMAKLAAQLAPMLKKASEVVDSKMPKPQGDPAVQKTFEAAMAEIQRKQKADEANMQMETQKLNNGQQMEMQKAAAAQQTDMQKFTATQQFEMQKLASTQQFELQKLAVEQQIQQARLAAEADQQQFEQRLARMAQVIELRIAEMEATGKREAEELRGRIELMKNEQDNQGHYDTETAKNTEDNQTNIIIAEMKTQMDLQTQSMAMIQAAIEKIFSDKTGKADAGDK